jgi:gliding motility-associated-like protein
VTTEGSYSVVVQNTALSCSREIGPAAVTVFTAPVAAFQAQATACTNENVSFTNQSSTDSRATPVYSWNFGDSKTSGDPNPVHAYTTANAFNVTLTVTYAGMTGCSHNTSKPITITGSTPPNITASPVSICPGEPSTLSIAGAYTSVSWNNGASGNSVAVSQPGTYSVNATDANGCPVSDEITLGQRPTPQVVVSAEKPVIAPGESVQLTASGADTYAWTPVESLNDAAIANPVATPAATTLYTVTGTLTGGCAAEADITITVDGSMILINPAVAFSPNGDGANETWTIDGVESYSDCTLSVFDGRGRRIYQKKGYTNDWDGTYQSKPVPDGTYYYVFGCPGKKPSTGSVLIFR